MSTTTALLAPTFADVRTETIQLLQEYDGDVAADDGIVLDRDIIRAVSEMARRTDCFWYAQSLAMVDGTAQYCAPGLLKLRTFNYVYQSDSGDDTTAIHWPLKPVRPEDLDRANTAWRDNQGDQSPRFVAIEGMNQFRLYQTPSIPSGASASVLVEGIADPTRCTMADGTTPLFLADADPWPLPAFATEAVPFRVAMYRAFQFPGDAVKMARYKMAKDEYERVLGDLNVYAMNFRPPYRYGSTYLWRGG